MKRLRIYDGSQVYNSLNYGLANLHRRGDHDVRPLGGRIWIADLVWNVIAGPRKLGA